MVRKSWKIIASVGMALCCAATCAIAAPHDEVTPAERTRIEQAIPKEAPAKPVKPRKLLIFDLNVGYPGHPSIRHANLALTLMGRKTGAYETVVSHDPAVFKAESLKKFAAVFFNNTVGNLFEDPTLRQSLLDFVSRGGGLLGIHGTSVAFTRWPGAVEDWPEFGRMLGTRGADHRASNESVFIKLDDAAHPINRAFGGKGFAYRDEFFRPQEPFSPSKVHVLLSIDAEKSPEAGQCAVAWVRSYGQGRVFYSTLGHNPSVFWDPTMLQFYLAAVQFALGDLPASTTPSAEPAPAGR